MQKTSDPTAAGSQLSPRAEGCYPRHFLLRFQIYPRQEALLTTSARDAMRKAKEGGASEV